MQRKLIVVMRDIKSGFVRAQALVWNLLGVAYCKFWLNNMHIFSLKLYNIYYIYLTFYHYKNRVCVKGHQTIPRPQEFCKLLSPFWNFWIHFWPLPLPLHVPHIILSRNIPVSTCSICKINHWLRLKQIEKKKSCSKLCLSVQKRKD